MKTAARLLLLGWLASSVSAAPPEPAVVRGFASGGIVFLPGGEVIFGLAPMPRGWFVVRWLTHGPGATWSHAREIPGLPDAFLVDSAGSGRPVLLVETKGAADEHALLEWSGDGFQPGSTLPAEVQPEALWLDAGGRVFVLCAQDGLVLHREGGEWRDHRLVSDLPGPLPEPMSAPNRKVGHTAARPVRALEAAGRAPWFYQPAVLTNGAACSSFHCLEDGVWRERRPGGASPFRISAAGANADGEVWCAGTAGELARCRPGREDFERIPCALAPGERVVGLEGLADGRHWLAMVLLPGEQNPPPRFRYQLRVFSADGDARPLPSLGDPLPLAQLPAPAWKVARAGDGGLWLAGAGPGLVCVNRDGTRAWRLDWTRGLPVGEVADFSLRDQRLWVAGRDPVAAVLPIPSLDEREPLPASREWTVERRPGMVLEEEGAFLHASDRVSLWFSTSHRRPGFVPIPVEAGLPRTIRRWDGTAWRDVPVPRALDMAEPVGASDGSLWMVDAIRVDVHRDGVWTSHATLEEALEEAVRLASPASLFTVGNPRAYLHAITGPRGAIVYRRGPAVLRWFDGKSWLGRAKDISHTLTGTRGWGSRALLLPGFGADGIPFAQQQSENYSPASSSQPMFITRHQWNGDEFGKADFRATPDPDLNGLPDNRGLRWRLENGVWTVGDATTRIRFPDEGTPLPSPAERLLRAHWGAEGDLWLALNAIDTGLFHDLAHRVAPRPGLAVAWAPPPPAVHPAGEPLRLAPRLPAGARGWLGWRLDRGATRLVPLGEAHGLDLGQPAPGAHRLEAWFLDEGAAAGPLFTHDFRVEKDPGVTARKTAEALAELKSPDPVRQQRGARLLREPGVQARAALLELRAAARPDERWWYDDLLRDLPE